MKTESEIVAGPLAAILVLALVVCTADLARGQELKPPEPKKASTNLVLPKAVVFQEEQGLAILPKQLGLGFAVDLAGRIVLGDWAIEGKVTAVSTENVAFTTNKNEPGHLVFRLPKGFELPLAVGDPVSITRKTSGYQASLGYYLVVASDDQPVMASGRQFGISFQKTKMLDGFALEQDPAAEQVLTESKYETIYQVPIGYIADGEAVKLIPGEARQVTIQGQEFEVMILRSFRVVPTKEYEGVAEGSGYILEYVMVAK